MVSTLLTSCGSKERANTLSILVPTGAPSVAFYNYSDDPKFQTNDNAATGIKSQVVNGSVDVAVLPTNLCVNLISTAHVNYKLAATITFGNFFIASTGNDDNDVMDDGDYIVLFQQNGLPDKLFHYLYGNAFDTNIRYANASNDCANILSNDSDNFVINPLNQKVDYVMISEPDLSIAMSYNSDVSIYKNIQEEYVSKTGGLKLFQASILINNNVSKELGDEFLNNLNKDIARAREDASVIEQGMNKDDLAEMHFRVKPSLAKSLTENGNKLGLGFEMARDNKQAIDSFLNLFGMENTNEEIFY